MPPIAKAVLASWSFPPWVTALNLLTAVLYVRGWSALHHPLADRFRPWRLACFLTGIATLQVALASPIDAFDPFFLTDHMLQHMLLMMIVPPLILLGDPIIPLLHGLPRWASRFIFGPIFRWRVTRGIGRAITYPPFALVLMSIVMIGWHLTAPYELALRSPGWHEIEHASFLISSLIFWWPVVQPWPSKPRWNRWTLPIYLLLADFVNSGLSAFLAFSGRVFYPSYTLVPRLGGISAQNDQVAAGAMMWVIGSFAYLVPAVLITARLLSPARPEPERRPVQSRAESRLRSKSLLALAAVLPLAALAFAFLVPDKIDIDGDIIRTQADSGPFHITVFTPPDSAPTDDFEIAVLTQDRDTGAIVLDDAVTVHSTSGQDAAKSMTAHASHGEAQNKILAAASIDLPSPGPWNLQVSVSRGKDSGSVSTSLDVQPGQEK
jgi:putative membrane protein